MKILPQKTRRNSKIIIFRALKSTKWRFVSAKKQAEQRTQLFNIARTEKLGRFTHARLLIFGTLLVAVVALSIISLAESNSRVPRQLDTLVVIPGEVTGVNWETPTHTLIQDVGENGVYQTFTRSNAAYFDGKIVRPEVPDENTTPALVPPPQERIDTTQPTTSESGSEVEQAPEETVSVPEGENNVPEATPEDTEDTPPPESPAEETVDEPAETVPEENSESETPLEALSKSFFRFVNRATELLPFAQVSVVEETAEEPDNASESETEVIPDPEPPAEPTPPETQIEPEEDVQPVPEDVEAETSPTLETEESSNEPTTTPLAPRDVSADEQVTASTTDIAPDETEPTSQDSTSDTIENELVFTDFGLPELNSGQFIENMQLRLSLGGMYEPEEGTPFPSLEVEYYLKGAWVSAGAVLFDGEVSNALNSGYFLFALPKIKKVSELEDFAVRVSYRGDTEGLDAVYIDSLWLQINTETFSKELLKERIRAENLVHLRTPELYELLSADVDFTRDELPKFSLKYESQRNFAVRLLRNIIGRDLAAVKSVTFENVNTGPADVTPQIDVTTNGLITIQLTEEDKAKLRPGEYVVEVTVYEGGKEFSDTFNFQWGLLAINPDQSEYVVGDRSTISLGALTRNGNTVCDANLRLYIIDPTEYISDVDVIPSGLCSGNNVIDVPDYSARFTPLIPGTYEMYVERIDEEGNVLSHTSDTFEVVDAHDVTVKRDGPTRIYPPAPYPMSITLTASTSWNGTLTERVPNTFTVFDTDAEIAEVGDVYELSWNVSLRAGESDTFTYNFDAPDLSPYLYTLGPARLDASQSLSVQNVSVSTTSATGTEPHIRPQNQAVTDFEEHRQWQIASDATGNMLLLWDGSGGLPVDWTCVSCTSGDPFFERFIMGSSTYNSVGGALTHTHSAAGSVLATSNSTKETPGGSTISVTTHTHSLTPTIGVASNTPLYRQLQVIQYTASAGEPPSIPTGAIGIFDGALPSGWTQYSAQNGYYIRGGNTIGSTAGSNTHTHSVTGTTGAAGGGTAGNRGADAGQPAAAAGHTHTISTSTANLSNEPPYIEVILASLDATSTAPNGLVTMWTEDVPGSWVDLSSNTSDPFSNRIIKANSTYGATGGASSHTHSNMTGVISSAVVETGVTPARNGSGGADITHTHSVSVTGFSTNEHLPPYVTVVFGKRQGTDPVFTQSSFRWYANENAQTPTDPWPSGATNLAEGAAITATNTPLKDGDLIRLRMNAFVENATATASTTLKLQYGTTTAACAAISSWTDVGTTASSTAWRGYNNNLVSDHSTLSSTTLASTTVAETYEENGYAVALPNDIAIDGYGEWDFVLEQNSAEAGTVYCFRLVESDGTPFSSYASYPRLLTNYAPEAPTPSKLFDNEKTASTTPWFEFVTSDPESEELNYQIQIDNDFDFSSTVFDHNTVNNSALFSNRVAPSDKDPFTSGELMRYIPNSSLTNGVTYWWRVRARDPDGSNQWGTWSSARSFTIDTGLSASAWFQTTEEQFDTNTYDGVEAVASDQVQLITGSSTGSMISTSVDFDDGERGTAWGSLAWNDTETTGDITYQLQYLDETSTWTLIPDSALSGNSTGFDTSPVNLLDLDTDTYNELRIVADFTNSGGSPSLQDITLNWGYRVETPSIARLFANEKVGTTTPTFEFTTTDPQSDSLTYQISWSTDITFTASTTRTSDTDTGFINANNGGDLDPFNSGDDVRFTIQGADALTNNATYWWRVRAKDTTGDNAYSLWTEPRSFTVDTTVVVSTWFQTTEEQFDSNILSGTNALPTDVLSVATTATEAMLVYGEGVETAPRYRQWNGSTWSSESTLNTIGAPLRWVVVRAGTTREEYVAATLGTDADINVQVFSIGEWGNLQEVTPSVSDISARGFDVAYETLSGDAIVVYCDGDATPSYYTWDGSDWTSGGTITVSETTDCTWIQLASDPVSDEIIMLMRGADGNPYEAQVWSGSGWANSTTQGSITEAVHEGMAVAYEESGGQALIVTSDGNPGRFRWNSWNGTTWGTAGTVALEDDFEWGELVQDDGSDALALCYMDEDQDIGMVEWSGTAWNTYVELSADGNAKNDPPFSCVYETTSGRDNYIMTVYGDTTATNYSFWNNSTWSTPAQINSIGDSATMQLVRTGAGIILGLFFDDPNDDLLASSWNGSTWSSTQTIESNASVDTSPYGKPYYIAPRNSGKEGTVIVTPPIYFSDGVGPYWDQMSWVDTTPGTSEILYSVQYYDSASSSWKFVPDSEIPGNEAGTTTSPIDLSGLSVSTYDTLRPYALLSCDGSNNCPQLQDWTLTWAEGITVSGTLMQYDQVSSTTAGTVAVAVNGALQVGKTGSVSNGFWSISNVTVFPGDTVTVFVSGAADAAEAVGVTRYDGTGDITGFSLYERHLALGSDDATTTPLTNSHIGLYDYTNSEDLFQNATGTSLTVCVETTCGDAELIIKNTARYQPGGSLTTHDFENNGRFLPQGNTITVSGSWDNNATTTMATSTVIFSATSSTETIDATGATNNTFYNVTLGTSGSTATWSLVSPLDVNGNLTVTSGTLSRGGVPITIAGNLTNAASGNWVGLGTTTFDGSGSSNWSDANPTLQDVGNVVINGSSKSVVLSGNVLARSVTVETDDILDASTSNYDITVLGSFVNKNTFVARSGEVFMGATTTNRLVTAGSDAFYDLTFNGVGGSWSFTENNLTVNNNLTIATGTLTMPTGTTTLAGSFSSSGGTFAHNNATVRFTSTGPETITVDGGSFTNAFYNLRFSGSGSFTFTDTHATTSNDFRITQGAVTLPSADLAVGGSFIQSGGSFAHNSGTVRFTSGSAETIDVNGSAFNSLSFNGSGSWSFADASVTANGSVRINSGSVTLPSTNFTIGGSYGNNATVAHNSGTVTFNSTDGGETINLGGSSLYAMIFNGVGGGWTVTNAATTTNNVTLTNASSFTLASGETLSVGGQFLNQVGGASTTWTGSTLSLESGAYSLNTKTNSGDTYGTLRIKSAADIQMWNSSATAYNVQSGGSLYSQDHAGVDGDLYIFGDYVRSTGEEHWSYETDFDGTDISGTPRTADVRLAGGATASLNGSLFSVIGSSTASTTVANQGSGTYTISVASGSTTLAHYEFRNLGTTGLRFSGTGEVAALNDGYVEPGIGSGTGFTVSSTTIDANPGLQIFRVNFSTTTAIAATNVTQTDGAPVSYWWFRNSRGNIDGEAFDNDTGDPGSIRWDDSSLVITVSGTVYEDDEVTPMGNPVCDDSTQVVRVVIEGGSSYTGSCDSGDGTFSIPGVVVVGDPTVTAYLDTNGGVRGVTQTKTPTADITNLAIYQNHVSTRHEDITPLTIEDMVAFDSSNDTDIPFTAATGTTPTLTVFSETELHISSSTTFSPGGAVTIHGNASSSPVDGSLHIDENATFIGSGTTTISIAGSFIMDQGATFTSASTTVVMNATTTGKTITTPVPQEITFNELSFVGVGGGWNINGDIRATQNIAVSTGTVTGTANVTVENGSFSGDGTVSFGSGTTTIERTNTLGGNTPWAFGNLVLGNGSVVGTTTPGGATTTVLGTLTIDTAHFLDAGVSVWNLAGTGTVFVEDGTFLEDTSTVLYSGTGAVDVLSTTYYNLDIKAPASPSTYTATGLGIIVDNALTVGGATTTTFTLNTNDPAFDLNGDVLINNTGILDASDIASFTVSGDWDNNGTFNSNNGTVTFDTSLTSDIYAGTSSFGNVIIDNNVGAFTVREHATSTGSFALTDASSFTLDVDLSLAVGGTFFNELSNAVTTWASSTLYLYGGSNHSINASTTDEDYENLLIGSDTDIRMWNTSAVTISVSPSGSLYSQNHNDINGFLYIFGDYARTSGTDYWSYARDFDGANLSGGNERLVTVFIAENATSTFLGGGLQVVGSSGNETTVRNQGFGTYALRVGGTASTTWNYYTVRDTNASGLTFSGTPTVHDFSNGSIEVGTNAFSAVTLGGTVIDANPARILSNNVFATSSGVSSATNVTATGTSVSAWRFTGHSGDIDGEDFDVDPGGNPGYVAWDDSNLAITISGNVYSDEGTTVSGVCDDSTAVVRLVGTGFSATTTPCSSATGTYTFTGITYATGTTLTVYIDGQTENGVTVTQDPISNINNLHIYENRVIVRHESASPLTIADMTNFDSSDDPGDVIFTAVSGSPDTLTLPANTKLIVWNGKEFEPNGNVTVSGGGAGAAYDGTLELLAGAQFTAQSTESHTVGGSLLSGAGAVLNTAQSTFTFTTTGSARTVDTNGDGFYNLTFSGSGSWTVSDTALIVDNDLSITQGAVTLPAATTTVNGSLLVTGGSFNANGGTMSFTSGAAEQIYPGGSSFGELEINGSGSFTLIGTNATATAGVYINQGTFTSATGTLAIGGDFVNGSTFNHGSGILRLTANSSTTLTAGGSDLFSTTFVGSGPYTFTDSDVALLGTLSIESGQVNLATGTMSIGGSFLNTGGTFETATNTVLFNSSDTGETINPGTSSFHNVSFSSASGGWTITSNATTTGNFTLTSANSFTLASSTTLEVEGMFTNYVGGGATTWTGSTLFIRTGVGYPINTKGVGGDIYGNLHISSSTALRAWDSSGSVSILDNSSSFYSQDNAGVSGALYIYGNYSRTSGIDWWSYATDFDGDSLAGSERQVFVYMAENATTTYNGGTLNIVGANGSDTVITNQGTGTYALRVLSGTINALYYSLEDMNANGLLISGTTTTVSSLAEGNYILSVNGGSLITLSSETLNYNTGLVISNASFATTSAITGYNIEVVGSTTGAWYLTGHSGNLSGEDFDLDGGTACGSVRWDDSSCLLTQQSAYRFRNDDGGEGVPNSEWFDLDWDKRKRVTLSNPDSVSYTDAAVKLNVSYDSDMQSDFDDLRFTTADGVTPIDHFIETYTASTDAIVWVKVPLLATSTDTEVYMYYGNGAVLDTSTSTTFSYIDTFEDNSLSEYSGDTGEFVIDNSAAYERTYRLEASDPDNGQTLSGGMYYNGASVSQGQKLRFVQYIDTSGGSGDEVCTLFGTQNQTQNYAVCLELYGTDRMSLVEDALYNDASGNILASTTVTYSTGWYEVEIDWGTDDSIYVTLSQNGSVVATTSATDSSYTSGGIGYALWYYHGAWDVYSARPLLANEPSVSFGFEQVSGGATWVAAENTKATGVEVDDVVRVRFTVENTGLTVTDQNYEIEFAAKGGAPSCEAVSYGNYVEVPPQSSCGTSDICMQSSSNITNLASTTDLLGGEGTFTYGQIVEDPDNNTGNITVASGEFTELEYVITPTSNVIDSNYCLRVTNEGNELDSYTKVAELELLFAPNITSLTLNGGMDIVLLPAGTTTIYATGTVSDQNGYDDLSFATTTFFRSGVTSACTADDNNCYIAGPSQCTYQNCAGDTCDVTCYADFYFHADPTDTFSPYAGETWRAELSVSDLGGTVSTATAPSIDLSTLRAINVDSAINYGTLSVNSDTGSYNATTTVENIGNASIDIAIEGSDLTYGASSLIPASEQIFATSTFTYSACTVCSSLSTTSSNYELDLTKPTSTAPSITDDLFWGIAIPFGVAGAPHQGTNTFYPISD